MHLSSQSLGEKDSPPVWKIAVVDDDLNLGQALKVGLSTSPQVGEVEILMTGEAMLSRGGWDDLDLAIVDLGLPGIGGLELIRELSRRGPDLRTAIFTVNESRREVVEAVRAGARGYLLKTAGLAGLLSGIEAIIGGHTLFSAGVVQAALEKAPPEQEAVVEGLSPRESQVLGMLSRGMLRKEMADQLGIGQETIHTHVKRLYARLGARGRREALTRARELGLA